MSRLGGSAFRLRRALGWGLPMLASGLLFAPPALGETLPPSENPLPPPAPAFQGADGNQDDTASARRLAAFSGGGQGQAHRRRERRGHGVHRRQQGGRAGRVGLQNRDWNGVNPGKANIRDAWAAVDQDGADTFVYLGFARHSAVSLRDATTFLTFELNHDARLWNNGHAMIPCRRTGDILISYEPHGNGVDVVLQRWRSTADDSGNRVLDPRSPSTG